MIISSSHSIYSTDSSNASTLTNATDHCIVKIYSEQYMCSITYLLTYLLTD